MKVEKVIPDRNVLGESGFWHSETESLIWVDIPDGAVLRYYPYVPRLERVKTAVRVSTAVPRSNGQGILISQINKLDILNRNGQQTPFVSQETFGLPDGLTTNDGKCDAKGRLWIGTLPKLGSPMSQTEPLGGLFRVTAQGEVTKHVSNLKVTNGMDWTMDNKTFFLADSGDKVVYAFDFDLEAGTLSRQRKLLEWPQSEAAFPDGLTVDVNDKMWVALFGGAAVVQYDIETGKELQKVNLSPTSKITCCNFGGKNLDELYVTTASKALTPEQLQAQPDAGGLFRVTGLGTKGRAPYFFAG